MIMSYSLRTRLYGIFSCKLQRRQLSTTNGAKSAKSRAPLLLGAMPVISFGLGTWQVYRLQWKKALIKQLEDRTMKEPLDTKDGFVFHSLLVQQICLIVDSTIIRQRLFEKSRFFTR